MEAMFSEVAWRAADGLETVPYTAVRYPVSPTKGLGQLLGKFVKQ